MKRQFTFALLIVFALLATVAMNSRGQAQNPSVQNPPGMMNGGMGRMMGMMGQMTTHHQQMSDLMNKLMESMTAIQTEKDPAKLQSKMAEHRALLEQMWSQMMQQGSMMQNMSGQMPQACRGSWNATATPSN